MLEPTVWLVDDDEDLRPALIQSLQLAGFDVHGFSDGAQLLDALAGTIPSVVVSDIRMPRMDGLELLEAIKGIEPRLPIILMTGHGDVALAVKAMQSGASDFVEKPFEMSRLCKAIEAVLDGPEGKEKQLAPLPLLGPSPIATDLRKRFDTLQCACAGALLIGPTGSGHTHLLTHLLAPFETDARPVITVNCANLSPDMAELELLATNGALVRARDGALVLESLSLIPDAVRTAIFQHATRPNAPVLFATIAASFRIDANMNGAFAERQLELPPLSRRREDITTLFLALARQASDRFRRPLPNIVAGMEDWLVAQSWQGNLGELQALAERFVLGSWSLQDNAPNSRLSERVAAHERVLIEAELERQDGSIKATYEALGLSRKGLYDKMKRYGISTEERG
ncbi:sigma-54 dependent transcriptional regulator [Ahrensia sp. R2A130]|uniref:sigma-54-dependent transcriptional regulator n=1 Tax=Ahrensia sp. R2A130 TaxID=744979 RepID=UPI0001E083D6|nr:response regulator [Ahrensia sp. R2A130]EFL89513.1 C4-dicarboxylate transport transcriptional regulatory protein DctD [Ahrensia sp. R2A130]